VAASETWSLRPGQTLQHRHWDGETVLYNDLSGDTHLLGDAALVLLLALQDGPATRQALAGALQAEFGVDALDPVDDAVDYAADADALLLNMKRLHLVDSHAC
jgi:PqqD family protein of HPr-rel-A system